jgi:hypothetical protein
VTVREDKERSACQVSDVEYYLSRAHIDQNITPEINGVKAERN